MSLTHTFVDDVFISYRHLDNELLDDHGKGWIDNFHERFESILGEALGYEPAIWRDPRLPGNVYFADALEERIRKTAVLISILSPGYLQSGWCVGELQEFCRLADQTGGPFVGDKMRVFKVVKSHIERVQHPPEFQKQLGYEFYEIDKTTQRPVAFAQDVGAQPRPAILEQAGRPRVGCQTSPLRHQPARQSGVRHFGLLTS